MDIIISTKDPDFTGVGNLVFQAEDGSSQRIENVDLIAEYHDLNESLGENEKKGANFLKAVRRYILGKHKIAVSVFAAQAYYETLSEMMGRADAFFMNPPGSPASTVSIPASSAEPSGECSTDSSTASEPKNTEN